MPLAGYKNFKPRPNYKNGGPVKNLGGLNLADWVG